MTGIAAMIVGIGLTLLYTRAPKLWTWEKTFYAYNIGMEVGTFSFGLLLFCLGLAITMGKNSIGNGAIFFMFCVLPLLLAFAGLLVLISEKATSIALRIFSAGPNPALNRKWLGIWLLAVGIMWLGAFAYLQS